jgi:Fe-S cluster assembly scaffold protein SufB
MIKLNKLPVPTFSWLGVNDTQREADASDIKTVTLDEEKSESEVLQSTAFEITARSGEIKSAVMFIDPTNKASIRTTVKAENSSAVTLVQVFEGKAQTVAKLDAKLSDDARFELIQIFLEPGDALSDINTTLGGRRSVFTANIGYLLGGSDRLDINIVARHLGKKTRSEINAKGVLDKNSRKTFKGTIDFVGGCTGASGAESEDTLLIGGKTVNKTVPLILCAEEDVEGSHGASIGRVDEAHIFYMQSRGIPEDKIAELMAQSKIAQIVNTIGDEETQARINNTLGRGNEDE